MRKINTIIVLILVITLVTGCGLTGTVNKKSVSSADQKLVNEVSDVAKNNGTSAAELLNQINDKARYEKALKKVLDGYYTGSKPSSQLASLTAKLDSRGGEILGNYASAFKERSNSDNLDYITGQVLVLTKEDVSKSAAGDIAERSGGEVEKVVSLGSNQNLAVVSISKEYTVGAATGEIEKDNRVDYVQPNYKYKLEDDSLSDSETKLEVTSQSESTSKLKNSKLGTTTKATTTNDTNVSEQWGLEAGGITGESGAWSKMTNLEGGEKVAVGVIDTGANLANEDLKDAAGYATITQLARFEGGKEYIPNGDDNGHGTHVTGIIAAKADNNLGIAGITHNSADVYVIDAADRSGYFMSIDLCLAVKKMVEQNVDVVNMSVGGIGHDLLLENEIKKAYDGGIVVVTASGNESTSDAVGPADSPYCIAVNAAKNEGEHGTFDMSYSNYGYDKDITAPGTDILSTYNKSSTSYKTETGTSMASPYVAAVVALVLKEAKDSGDTSLGTGSELVRNVRNILYTSPVNADIHEFAAESTGFGIINGANAIEKVNGSLEKTDEVTKIALNRTTGTVYAGNTLALEYKVLPGNIRSALGAWSSSDSAVAAVDSNGVVTGKKAGTATITLQVGDKTATCKVTVKGKFAKIDTKAWSKTGSISNTDAMSTSAILDSQSNETASLYCDGYYFYCKASETIKICMQSSQIDSYLKLSNSSGKCVKYNDDIDFSNINSYISYTVPTTGYYYLETIALPDQYTGRYTGSYRLSVMKSTQKVSSAKVKYRTKSTVRIGWSKTSTATNLKYRVYIYNSKKKYLGSKYVSTNYYRKTGMKRKQKYYFKVRPYLTTSKGNVYGKSTSYIKGVSK